jgi:Tol biopolymer transport system component
LNQEDLRALLRSGIEAAQNNNTILARSTFRQVLEEDPNNELAWMWLAQVVDTQEERRQALQQVLRINPNNERAQEALKRLSGTAEASQPATGLRTTASRADQETGQVYIPQKRDRRDQPSELWKGTQQEADDNRTLYLLAVLLIAIGLIIGGLLLLIDRLTVDSETEATDVPVVVVGTATIAPTSGPPTRARTPIDDLSIETAPATFTPEPTLTLTAVPTETPEPAPPEGDFALVFASANRLYTVSDDGENQRPISFEFGEGISGVNLQSPVISPDGDSILFTADTGTAEELFIGDADGGNVQQLTSLDASQTIDAAWSPDGERIAFASNADGDFDLFIVDADGGSPVKLFDTDERNEREPAWSPDGNHLAYSAGDLGGFDEEIFVLPLNDQDSFPVEEPVNVCQMTDAPRLSFSPAWSPDGSQIAFISNRNDPEETDLYVMASDGTQENLISVGDDFVAGEFNPSWSPDSRWIAVESSRLTDEELLAVEPTDAPSPSDTPDPEADVQLAPTATSRTVSFARENTRLWLIDVATLRWYLITPDDEITDPYWLPSEEVEVPDDIGFRCAGQ